MNSSGKEPSEKARLMIVVMGWRRESRHDLRSLVGILSKLQVALDDERIAFCTSVLVAGEKLESRGIGLREVW